MLYKAYLDFDRQGSCGPKGNWTLDLIFPASFTEMDFDEAEKIDWRKDMEAYFKSEGWQFDSAQLDSLFSAMLFLFKMEKEKGRIEATDEWVVIECSEALGLPLGSAVLVWLNGSPHMCYWEMDSKDGYTMTLKHLYKKYACFCKMCPAHIGECKGKRRCHRPDTCC